MALAIGNKTVELATPSATTRTFSHNMSTGSNGYLFIVLAMSNSTTFSGVTYGGVAMTLMSAFTTTVTNTNTNIYSLQNPPTGANNVVVTFGVAQYNPVSSFAFSATGCSGSTNYNFFQTTTSPNAGYLTVSANSLIFADLIAGNNVGHTITIDGSSRPLEYTSAINNYTSGAFSATGLTAGSKLVSLTAGAILAGNAFEITEFAAATGGLLMMF